MIERDESDQKKERRQQIVDVAAELFETRSYDEISMQSVADGACIAKGTVYLYFPTKAELFLDLAVELLDGWFERLNRTLVQLEDTVSEPTELADLIVASLSNADRLKRILTLLPNTIAKGLSVDSAASYKKYLTSRMTEVSSSLSEATELLDEREALQLWLWLYSFVVGLDQLANPAEPVAEAVERDDIELFDIDFDRQLSDAIRVWLSGFDS
jgi:AcrR family transcriptional regulator